MKNLLILSAQSLAIQGLFTTPPSALPDPLLLYTDFTAGPVTGGENNKGFYLSIYGVGLGSVADYVSGKNVVTIGGIPVDNYRCCVPSICPVMAALGVQRLTVQVGTLAGLTLGTAYPVAISVNGVVPINATSGGSYLDQNGTAITYTPATGTIVFVDFVNGNNANAGTFASPLKELQTSTGTSGALRIAGSANGTDGTPPSTYICLRAATMTSSGRNGRLADLFRITGLPATGAANRGPICITSYPGPIGGNAPELVHAQLPTGMGGGFNGNDSARSNEVSTAYGGFTGWCQDMQFSNFQITSNATAPSDGGVMNAQSSARRWRIIGMELSWPSTVTGAQHGRSGGIEGSLIDSVIYGNYIHNIQGDTSANENHGIYLDGNILVANNVTIAYNQIEDIGAGNGIQTYDGVNGAGITGIKIYNNWISMTNKHNVNIADNTKDAKVWNNVLLFAGESSMRCSTSAATAANAFIFANNVCYGWSRVYATQRWGFQDDANLGTGSASGRLENNIFMIQAGHQANSYDFVYLNSGRIGAYKNRWYDASSRLLTKPSADATGSYGIPGFTDASGLDFSLATGSACIDAGNVPTGITRGLSFNLKPTPINSHDIGAFER